VKERAIRLRTIKNILQSYIIESQEILLEHLAESGFNVTQATLSRDLKLLKVAKISDGTKGYHYTLPGEERMKDSDQSFIQDILRGFISLDFSGNLGVMHTMPGHADSVALAIDNLNMKEILGTMAGDDTILLVIREGYSGEKFFASFRERVPQLEL
jgi:transcriptional regulator of arginine metabolism